MNVVFETKRADIWWKLTTQSDFIAKFWVGLSIKEALNTEKSLEIGLIGCLKRVIWASKPLILMRQTRFQTSFWRSGRISTTQNQTILGSKEVLTKRENSDNMTLNKQNIRTRGDKMIPIVGNIKAWTVIWNLALIGITGGAWLGVLIVWALCKFVFSKKSWYFSPKGEVLRNLQGLFFFKNDEI